jgi:hypothetical protein
MTAALLIAFGMLAIAVATWVTITNAREWKKLPPDQLTLSWTLSGRLPEPARTVQQRNMTRMFVAGLGLTILFLLLGYIGSYID